MQVGRFLCVVVAAGLLSVSYATQSRVLTMGGNDHFFMDDVSIFKNPANINIYPNMLLGELGQFSVDPSIDTVRYAGLTRYNRDPLKPSFGGILSYSLNRTAESGDQYPMLSIGAVLNRYDDMLGYIMPGSGSYAGSNPDSLGGRTLSMMDPVGKIDLIVGYALKNGGMIGIGGYLAFQKQTKSDVTQHESSLYNINFGLNWPLTKTMDLEVSAGGSQLTGIGRVISYDTVTNKIIPDSYTQEIVANGDMSVRGDIRLFSAMTTLNGDFVPHAGFEVRNLADNQMRFVDINGGLGMNLNIDRGFFWAGIEGLYQSSVPSNDLDSTTECLGGRVSFGIERNIVWDWFLLRAGGNKTIMYERVGEGSGRWLENPESTSGSDDVLSIGAGVNIENRFKIDGIVAEDIFYTFTNLISGNHHHIMTRLSATYSF